MAGGKVGAGFSVFLVAVVGSGCMRFHSNVYYEHHAQIEIVEDGSNGSRLFTTAAYREWGLGPGEDGIYGTGDDDLAGGYTRIIRDKADRLQSVSYSESPGPDGLWFTDDDKVIPLANFVTNGNMEVWTIHTAQLASVSTLLDDIFYPPSLRRTWNGPVGGSVFSGRPQEFNYNNVFTFQSYLLPKLAENRRAGGQEIDGSASYHFLRVKTEVGLEIRQVLSSGVDGRWGTNDDLVGRLWRLAKAGTAYSILEYSEPGSDRLWGTEDDAFASGAYLELNATGDIVAERYVTDLGVDKHAFTADDNYVAAIDRRSWSEGERKFVSIVNALPAGPADVGPVDHLSYSFSDLFVFDRSFQSNYWIGPTEHFFFYQQDVPARVSHHFVSNNSVGETNESVDVGLLLTELECLPADLVTLEPCVTRIRAQELPAGNVFQRVHRISDTTIQKEILYADPLYFPYNSKFITIDRTAK